MALQENHKIKSRICQQVLEYTSWECFYVELLYHLESCMGFQLMSDLHCSWSHSLLRTRTCSHQYQQPITGDFSTLSSCFYMTLF